MIARIRGWIVAFFRRVRGDADEDDTLVEITHEPPPAQRRPIEVALDVLTTHMSKIPGASVRSVTIDRNDSHGEVVTAVAVAESACCLHAMSRAAFVGRDRISSRAERAHERAHR